MTNGINSSLRTPAGWLMARKGLFGGGGGGGGGNAYPKLIVRDPSVQKLFTSSTGQTLIIAGTIPANSLQAGDVIRFSAMTTDSSATDPEFPGTNTLHVRCQIKQAGASGFTNYIDRISKRFNGAYYADAWFNGDTLYSEGAPQQATAYDPTKATDVQVILFADNIVGSIFVSSPAIQIVQP